MEALENCPYRFDIEDPKWLEYLENNGYVVIKAVADKEEVETAIDLFWKHFEATKNVKRDDMETWEDWRTDRRGIITDAGVIQCAGAWYIRGLPKVKTAFSKIWNTDSLIVSMDSLLLWKPWWHNKALWTPRTEGLHLDQNPFQKPSRECVQGMVPLYDVTKATGGLEVVPKSNLPEAQEALKQKMPHVDGTGDFCIVPPSYGKQRTLLLAQAGDLILWDSRTIHGGNIGTGESEPRNPPKLARMTQTVCMLPRASATQDVLERRKSGFQNGYGFTHWANEIHITSYGSKDYKPVDLTPEQLALL